VASHHHPAFSLAGFSLAAKRYLHYLMLSSLPALATHKDKEGTLILGNHYPGALHFHCCGSFCAHYFWPRILCQFHLANIYSSHSVQGTAYEAVYTTSNTGMHRPTFPFQRKKGMICQTVIGAGIGLYFFLNVLQKEERIRSGELSLSRVLLSAMPCKIT
jgi:hypothetical protein